MAPSLISRLIFCVALCAPIVLSVPVTDPPALERRLLPDPDPDSCLPPLVLCDRACCGSTSICGPTGLCAPKPPPIPGQLWVTYTNDPQGRPCVINIHGRHFNTTADLEIQMVQNGYISNPWTKYGISSHNFDYNTGFQDCSKTGRRTSSIEGNPAHVFVWDDAYIAYTGVFDHSSAIPVRVTANGICP